MARHGRVAPLTKFGDSPFDPFAPTSIRFFTLDLAHESFDFGFGQSKLGLYGFKRRAVFPRHHDDSVGVLERKLHRFGVYSAQMFT